MVGGGRKGEEAEMKCGGGGRDERAGVRDEGGKVSGVEGKVREQC